MPTPSAPRRHLFIVPPAAAFAAVLFLCGTSRSGAADDDSPGAVADAASGSSHRVVLFNGRDMTGWKVRNASGAEAWKVVADAKLDPSDPKKLVGSGIARGLDGVLLRGPIDHGSDIYTEKTFGDCELHVEFAVPRGSNSGVYLMGEYEVQVFDSFGKPDNKLGQGDVGAIYSTAKPTKNAAKAPGEWQTFDIVFQAPRFAKGKKTQNAKFVSVKLNGQEIQKDVEVKGPTGSQLSNDEKPTGPVMLQGDHGIVAFRNMWIKTKQAEGGK